jgi:hypothetical protein
MVGQVCYRPVATPCANFFESVPAINTRSETLELQWFGATLCVAVKRKLLLDRPAARLLANPRPEFGDVKAGTQHTVRRRVHLVNGEF